ncbi:glycoside hydrolase N-terminal domain-containing protein [Algoriphagus sp. AK58]|uniref:glycoside hydrolase family 95 protein n=1 Tax=Algoriphagus sp. AK58 TaxID=1406877 RepID=UPI001C9CFB66|nr:glycoside hydrolase family 95 protein [Algoriphagus sp. AK58]
MKNRLLLLIAFLLVSTLVNAQNPNVLWYNTPSKNWDAAHPIGNGRLGAMVFGDVVNERIQLNEESLWAGSKADGNANAAAFLPLIQEKLLTGHIGEAKELAESYLKGPFMRIRSYQSLGDIRIHFFKDKRSTPDFESYRRSLNMREGIAEVDYSYDKVLFHREVFVSAVDDVLVIRLKASKPGMLTFKLDLSRSQDAIVKAVSSDELELLGQIVDLPDKDASPKGLHMKFSGRVIGKNKGGTLQTVNNSFWVENADEVVFYMTAATDYSFEKMDIDRSIDPSKVTESIIANVVSKSYEAIKMAHVNEHTALYDRVKFSLGSKLEKEDLPTDVRLSKVKAGGEDLFLTTQLFQFGRYLLMSSSRAPGKLPANLQGIWNEYMVAPWNSDFHTNINLQMNYWPADVTNLSETFAPFADLVHKMREPGAITAEKTFGAKGWTVNHLTNVFGHTSISDGVGWGTFPMAGPWLVTQLYDHYQFTGNQEFLENILLPTMQGSVEFVLSFLVKDKNGYYVTAPSNSPENTYILPNGEKHMLTYGATMDIQIARALLIAFLEIAEERKELEHLVLQSREVLSALPPTKVSARYGIIQEWLEDYEEAEPGHRHISQLFSLYPGKEITSRQPELFEAAKKTLNRRLEYAVKGEGFYTGWSRAWMINFFARLKDGEGAWKNILEMKRQLILDNLFDTHPPFQIDGNFGLTAGIAEMLLQSHEGEIELLPALPTSWDTGEIKGLMARGGYEVSMVWAEHKLTQVEIKSLRKNNVRLSYLGRSYSFSMNAGESLSLVLNKDRLKRK